jgi:hypothetical protein
MLGFPVFRGIIVFQLIFQLGIVIVMQFFREDAAMAFHVLLFRTDVTWERILSGVSGDLIEFGAPRAIHAVARVARKRGRTRMNVDAAHGAEHSIVLSYRCLGLTRWWRWQALLLHRAIMKNIASRNLFGYFGNAFVLSSSCLPLFSSVPLLQKMRSPYSKSKNQKTFLCVFLLYVKLDKQCGHVFHVHPQTFQHGLGLDFA